MWISGLEKLAGAAATALPSSDGCTRHTRVSPAPEIKEQEFSLSRKGYFVIQGGNDFNNLL